MIFLLVTKVINYWARFRSPYNPAERRERLPRRIDGSFDDHRSMTNEPQGSLDAPEIVRTQYHPAGKPAIFNRTVFAACRAAGRFIVAVILPEISNIPIRRARSSVGSYVIVMKLPARTTGPAANPGNCCRSGICLARELLGSDEYSRNVIV